MEMPPALKNMLNHLLKTHGSIKSWNIYQGDNGIVNVNIRFSDITGESNMPVEEPVSYKRVSSRQLARNKVRANTYKSKQQANAHTQTDTINTEMDTKKRKFENSPECARNDQVELDTSEVCHIDTPIKILDLNKEDDVNNAEAYETARHQIPDVPPQKSANSYPGTIRNQQEKATIENDKYKTFDDDLYTPICMPTSSQCQPVVWDDEEIARVVAIESARFRKSRKHLNRKETH